MQGAGEPKPFEAAGAGPASGPGRETSRAGQYPLVTTTDDGGVLRSLIALLAEVGVPYRLCHHEPVTTSEEAAAARGTDLASGAKAMLVKGKGGFALAVLAADRRIEWKLLNPLVGGKGARFANDGELMEATGLAKGAVPPIGALFGLRTIYDASLLDVDVVAFNAGSRSDSIEMSRADLIRLGGGEVASFSVRQTEDGA